MKKISAFILSLVLTISFTACASMKYEGSRIGNDTQLIMDYKVFNTTDSQTLELAAGDVVNCEVISNSGSIDIVLQKSKEEPIYNGTNISTATFQIVIEESGKYSVSVTGNHAKGSVHITTNKSNAEKSDLSKIE